MAVERSLVLHVASLAHLELSEADVIYYQTQLGKILEHIEVLAKMPDPLGDDWRSDVLGEPTPERADVEKASLTPEDAMSQAPRRVGTAFQVPRIIE